MRDEVPAIHRAARQLHTLIAELEANIGWADGRSCWMELDTALHFLHASAMSLDEATDGCRVDSVAAPATAGSSTYI